MNYSGAVAERCPAIPEPLTRDSAIAPARSISRDLTLDMLRGWAIVLMVANHVGPSTLVCTLAHFTWYVTAANWFVALSGVVLGMVSVGRLRKEGRRQTYMRVLSRAFSLWVIHCVLMFALILFHESTGRLHEVASVSAAGGWLKVLWMVPTLRLTSNEFMNILPMYVIFLGLTPIALECMQRRKTGLVLLASLCLYVAAQMYPEWGRISDPISGKRIFSVEAWQFVYVIGLCAGYHRERITKELWPRYRSWLLPLCITVFAALFGFALLQRPTFAWVGLRCPAAGPYFWGKLTAAPGQTLYFFATMVVSYWVIQQVQRRNITPLQRFLRPLETIGRYSLYCFLVHIVISLAARAVNADTWPRWEQEVLTIASVCIVYVMAKYRILAKYIPN